MRTKDPDFWFKLSRSLSYRIRTTCYCIYCSIKSYCHKILFGLSHLWVITGSRNKCLVKQWSCFAWLSPQQKLFNQIWWKLPQTRRLDDYEIRLNNKTQFSNFLNKISYHNIIDLIVDYIKVCTMFPIKFSLINFWVIALTYIIKLCFLSPTIKNLDTSVFIILSDEICF